MVNTPLSNTHTYFHRGKCSSSWRLHKTSQTLPLFSLPTRLSRAGSNGSKRAGTSAGWAVLIRLLEPTRFGSMRLLPMGLFEVYRLQRSTTDPSSHEDKHSERHRRNTGGHASESVAKLQKSTQSVHRQCRPSFDRCNF